MPSGNESIVYRPTLKEFWRPVLNQAILTQARTQEAEDQFITKAQKDENTKKKYRKAFRIFVDKKFTLYRTTSSINAKNRELSPSIHKYGDVFTHSGLSAE
jgi:hypothetical protein